MWFLVFYPAQDPTRVPVSGGDAGGRAWLAPWARAVCPEPQVASLSLPHQGPCGLLSVSQGRKATPFLCSSGFCEEEELQQDWVPVPRASLGPFLGG